MKAGECKDIFRMLSEYLDRELPEDLCQQIDAHISDCPPCIEFVRSLRKSVELCRSFKPSETPEPLSDEARTELLESYQKMLLARRR